MPPNDEMMIHEDIKELNDEELRKISKGDTIEYIYHFFIDACIFLINWLSTFLKCSGIYLLWIGLHYFSAHLYVKCCVPNTVFGFFMSPFMISTPHCQGLRWIVYHAASVIDNMWLLLGTWFYSLIWTLNLQKKHT